MAGNKIAVKGKAPVKAEGYTKIGVLDHPILIPDGVVPVYSDAFAIQYAREAFILSFLKVMHPLNEGLSLEAGIESRCIVQVAISPTQMAENLKVMMGHYISFASAQEPPLKKHLLERAGLAGVKIKAEK